MKKKVNITSKIIGRMEEDKMMLYYHNRVIGQIDLNSIESIHLKDGFEVDNHQIYVLGKDHVYTGNYAESCDLGWC